jgi:hypothetical protein
MRDYRSSKSADESTDKQRTGVDDEEGYDREAVRARSLWLLNRAVQRLAADPAATKDDAAVQETAAAGVAGAGIDLPHREQIQAAFGPHDVSHVRAHVGGDAAQAAGAIGAKAYATGNDVAFADAPDLHTAAHEAAHVVQQRQGVHLKGGVGQEGDAYEQQAAQSRITWCAASLSGTCFRISRLRRGRAVERMGFNAKRPSTIRSSTLLGERTRTHRAAARGRWKSKRPSRRPVPSSSSPTMTTSAR